MAVANDASDRAGRERVRCRRCLVLDLRIGGSRDFGELAPQPLAAVTPARIAARPSRGWRL
jgi:hypothetical protein